MDTDNQAHSSFLSLYVALFVHSSLLKVQLKVQHAFIFHSHLPLTYSLENLSYYSSISQF